MDYVDVVAPAGKVQRGGSTVAHGAGVFGAQRLGNLRRPYPGQKLAR